MASMNYFLITLLCNQDFILTPFMHKHRVHCGQYLYNSRKDNVLKIQPIELLGGGGGGGGYGI